MKTTLFARFRSSFLICLVVILGAFAPADVYAQLGNVFKRTFTKPPSELFRNTPEMLETEYVCFLVFDSSVANCGFTHKVIGLKQPANDFENNGGHSHNGDRPFVDPADGELEFDGADADPSKLGIKGQTANKTVIVKHRMPQVSGKMIVERIITTLPGFFCGHDCFTITSWKFEDTINVTIADEQRQLPPGPGTYIRCAKTLGCVSDAPDNDPDHVHPFFGKSELVNLLIGLAAAHRARFTDVVPAGIDRVLRITDMTLLKGGLFDLNEDWEKPHISHRRGTSADISRFTLLDGSVNVEDVNQEVIDRYIKRLGLKRETEKDKTICPLIGKGAPCIHVEL